MLPAAAITLQRQQEAALQRVLEEEILKEMTRENALQQVSPPVPDACLFRAEADNHLQHDILFMLLRLFRSIRRLHRLASVTMQHTWLCQRDWPAFRYL